MIVYEFLFKDNMDNRLVLTSFCISDCASYEHIIFLLKNMFMNDLQSTENLFGKWGLRFGLNQPCSCGPILKRKKMINYAKSSTIFHSRNKCLDLGCGWRS